jgi:hypothetical protein
MAFAKGLNDEDKRAMAESLTEEELTIFDCCMNPNYEERCREG